ncbi:hypothetical protein ACRAWF_32100 [Streptomyces sp. L7]
MTRRAAPSHTRRRRWSAGWTTARLLRDPDADGEERQEIGPVAAGRFGGPLLLPPEVPTPPTPSSPPSTSRPCPPTRRTRLSLPTATCCCSPSPRPPTTTNRRAGAIHVPCRHGRDRIGTGTPGTPSTSRTRRRC